MILSNSYYCFQCQNYNTIKLGNFRTYEDLRYQLVQWSGTLHQDFILRAYDVKIKIKKNIGESFKNKFMCVQSYFFVII